MCSNKRGDAMRLDSRVPTGIAMCALIALSVGVAPGAHASDCDEQAAQNAATTADRETRLDALLLKHRPYLAVQHVARPEPLSHR